MLRNTCRSLSLLLLGVLIFSPTAAFAGDAAKGKEKYASLCATCHGATGKGDGAVAASLPPEQKPRDLVSGQMKFATDESKFGELLKKGGPAVGLSPLMPPQSGLADSDIADLYAFIQSLKTK